MKRSILAPLCSAFVLPGLGQIINQQIIKGLVLMGVVFVLFIAILIKAFFDFSAVVSKAMGAGLTLGPGGWPLILEGMKERNLTLLLILVGLSAGVWLYAVVDAAIHGRGAIDED